MRGRSRTRAQSRRGHIAYDRSADDGVHPPQRPGNDGEASKPRVLGVADSARLRPGRGIRSVHGRLPEPLHSWHTPVPSHPRQSTPTALRRKRFFPRRLPVPSHRAQRRLPLQNLQGAEPGFVSLARAMSVLPRRTEPRRGRSELRGSDQFALPPRRHTASIKTPLHHPVL
jgi:hypothetical protein